VVEICNYVGKGTLAICEGKTILLGSASFLQAQGIKILAHGAGVYLAVDHVYKGKFVINHVYRAGVKEMVDRLKNNGYQIHLLSGDHPTERQNLQGILGATTPMLFEQNPNDKLEYIQHLQSMGRRVMMVGDGLNDAGALKKCDLGIAVTDQTHLFTPASDAILEGEKIPELDRFISYAQKAKTIIIFLFILSIIYNLIGMYFATRAQLSPMVAAILMPISSISIVALSALLSHSYTAGLLKKN